MLIVACNAMSAQTALQRIIEDLENGMSNTEESTDCVIDLIQTFLVGAGALYFTTNCRWHKHASNRYLQERV